MIDAKTVGVGEGLRVTVGVAVGFVVVAATVAFFVTAVDAGAVLLAACGEGVGEEDKHPAIDTSSSATIQTQISVVLNLLSSFM
ncbi:MAG: hypothetical protein ACXV3E_04850 [Halobacteriota archaeon]